MRCAKGDLAVIVRGRFSGIVVTCLELVPSGTSLRATNGANWTLSGPHWRVDRRFAGNIKTLPDADYLCADDRLMPLRPEAEPEAVEYADGVGV